MAAVPNPATSKVQRLRYLRYLACLRIDVGRLFYRKVAIGPHRILLLATQDCARLIVVALAISLFPFATPVHAENPVESTSSTIKQATNEIEEYGFRSGSYLVAPVPFKNPTIGAGLALGGAYLFQFDPESNTSHIALGGLKSDNGTNGFGLSGSFSWDANRWQLSATVAQAEAFYDLYVGGLPIAIFQTGDLFTGTLLYGFTPKFSLGPKIRYLDTTVGLDQAGVLPPGIIDDTNLTLANFGLVARWDTRDDTLYPQKGFYVNSEILGGTVLSGGSREYGKAFVNLGLYKALSDTTVLASYFSTCGASSDAPFFDKCALGAVDSFRGFSSTQYYDQRSLSVQLELRQRFGQRFGAVAFAGTGMTGSSYGTLSSGGLHSAAGVGLRFQLTKKFKTDFSVDVSYNDEDEQLVYIYVGQRF